MHHGRRDAVNISTRRAHYTIDKLRVHAVSVGIIQEEELSEARWFEREDVPVLPFHISVGHELIQKFRDGEI